MKKFSSPSSSSMKQLSVFILVCGVSLVCVTIWFFGFSISTAISSESSSSSSSVLSSKSIISTSDDKQSYPTSFASLVISLTRNSFNSDKISKNHRRSQKNNLHWWSQPSTFDFTLFHRSTKMQAEFPNLQNIFPCTRSTQLSSSWSFKKVMEIPTRRPICFLNLKTSLRTLKFYVSVALGRLAFDEDLENDYQKLLLLSSSSSSSSSSIQHHHQLQDFIHATERLIASYFVFTNSVLQTFIDADLLFFHRLQNNNNNNNNSLMELFSMETNITFSIKTDANEKNEMENFLTKKLERERAIHFKSRWLENNLRHSLLPDFVGESQNELLVIRRDNNNNNNHHQKKSERSSRKIYNHTGRSESGQVEVNDDENDFILIEREEKRNEFLLLNQSFSGGINGVTQKNKLMIRKLHWKLQRPREGRFWNMFRPFLSCSTSPRTCELPEGCRFVCNPEHLVSSSSRNDLVDIIDDKRRRRQRPEIIGIGSNNEFDWEESLIRLYSSSNDETYNKNHLPMFTIFDCTIDQFRPSRKIQEYIKFESLFRFVPYCVAESFRTIYGQTSSDLVREGTFGRNNNNNNQTSSRNSSTKYFPISSIKKVLDHVDLQHEIKSVGEYRSIDILKLDAESFEFVAIPEWTRRSLKQIGRKFLLSSKRKTNKNNKFFDLELHSDVKFLGYEIQQFQYELHRRGWVSPHGANVESFFHTFILQLQLLAHGFVTFQSEKNHFANCCYELAMVHYRFFIRSESKL